MKELENNVVTALISMRNQPTYETRFEQNAIVKKALRAALSHDESFNYAFDSLGKLMGTMIAPDKAFRLFNWNLDWLFYDLNLFKITTHISLFYCITLMVSCV